MPLAKSKNNVGLGNSLMNDRFGKGKGQDMRRGTQGIERVGSDGQTYITTPKQMDPWMKMRSITEQPALDEFLNTADLAGTEFTAEKMHNVKVIHSTQRNPHLLSAAEERAVVKKQNANKDRLKVPRRPPWNAEMSREQLDEREKQSQLEWRRSLAELQETHDLLMTPFERNLEVWRQLWRVIERSDLIVQIVDARNPLLFRCEDLETYVNEVDRRKHNLLLVNKADMMTPRQRKAWADYFRGRNIKFRFFSAELASSVNESDECRAEGSGVADEMHTFSNGDSAVPPHESGRDESTDDGDSDDSESSEENVRFNADHDTDIDIITTHELEALFLENAPNIDSKGSEGSMQKITVGLVGYPNVGKSSTINALLGAKKVSVSATPGKTKHFQTIHLSESIILCDCPGLVFPNFANTKAELVTNGVLPIDQLREYTGPAALIAGRIPRSVLERTYGIKIIVRPLEEGGTGIPTGEELLQAYAKARGFSTQGLGQPDESRAARYIIKDFVKGKLLFCHPPPTSPPTDEIQFNQELNNSVFGEGISDEASIAQSEPHISSNTDEATHMDGKAAKALDRKFFSEQQSNLGHIAYSPHGRYITQSSTNAKNLSGRKLKTIAALDSGVDASQVRMNSKKHFKRNKKKKTKPQEPYVA